MKTVIDNSDWIKKKFIDQFNNDKFQKSDSDSKTQKKIRNAKY